MNTASSACPQRKGWTLLADDLAFAAHDFTEDLAFPASDSMLSELYPDWVIPTECLSHLQTALNDYYAARVPNAGGRHGFERWRGAADPRDDPPGHDFDLPPHFLRA